MNHKNYFKHPKQKILIMRNIIFTSLLLLTISAYSQEVSNIITRQNEDKIDITYNISNSTTDQLFYVTIYCAIDGKEKIQLMSVTGDVGDNISGGQGQYKITWDVLKDVDELNSAEFFIKIEMKKDGSSVKPIKPIAHNKWAVGYNLSFNLPIGFRISYLGNWGGYFGFRTGTVWNDGYISKYYYAYNTEADYNNGTYLSDYYYSEYDWDYNQYSELGVSINLGVTKRLINKPNFQLHTYAGFGFGYWGQYSDHNTYYYDLWTVDPTYSGSWYSSYYDNWGYMDHVEENTTTYTIWGDIDLEFGGYLNFKRVSTNVGFSYSNTSVDMVLGLGYMF